MSLWGRLLRIAVGAGVMVWSAGLSVPMLNEVVEKETIPAAEAWHRGFETNPATVNDWTKPLTWMQWQLPANINTEDKAGAGNKVCSNSMSANHSSCYQYTKLFFMIKSGARPLGYSLFNFFKEQTEAGFNNPTCNGSNGQELDALSGGYLKAEGGMEGVGGLRGAALAQKVKGYMDQGYLVALNYKGNSKGEYGGGKLISHWVGVDRVDGDKVMVMDSGWDCEDLNSCKANVSGVLNITRWKYTKGDVNSLPTIEQLSGGTATWKEGSAPKDNKVSGEMVNGSYLPNELALEGMPKLRNLKGEVDPAESLIGVLDDPGLTVQQTKSVSALRNDIAAREKGVDSFLRTVVAFIGILGLVYALFLPIAYIFDKTNVVFNMNLLGLITFGKFRAIQHGDASDGQPRVIDGVRYVNGLALLWRVVLVMLFSGFLISGLLYDVLIHVITWLRFNFNLGVYL